MPFPISTLKSLPKATYESLIVHPLVRVTFSQLGEDILLYHLLSCSPELQGAHFYVDVGACHPIIYSNTTFLHMAGWRGLTVDANIDSINALKSGRPNDIHVHCGVGETESVEDFYRLSRPAMSTFSKTVADEHRRQFPSEPINVDRVPIRTINSILSEYLPPGQKIDVMSIDIEGQDPVVIRTLDFERFRPTIICVELDSVDMAHPANDPTIARLLALGYKLWAVCHISFIFVSTRP